MCWGFRRPERPGDTFAADSGPNLKTSLRPFASGRERGKRAAAGWRHRVRLGLLVREGERCRFDIGSVVEHKMPPQLRENLGVGFEGEAPSLLTNQQTGHQRAHPDICADVEVLIAPPQNRTGPRIPAGHWEPSPTPSSSSRPPSNAPLLIEQYKSSHHQWNFRIPVGIRRIRNASALILGGRRPRAERKSRG